MNKKEKLSYFNRVVDVDVDGKMFWKFCKPFIYLYGNFVQVANVFNVHFNNITISLNVYNVALGDQFDNEYSVWVNSEDQFDNEYKIQKIYFFINYI